MGYPMSWKDELEGPKWLPVLNMAEESYQLPHDLLARMAYQECSFKPRVIDGTQASPAGALGMMQLMPEYFFSVRVPTPFSPEDTGSQIEEAAQFVANLYTQTHNWQLTVAAYNAGLGAVQRFGAVPPYEETQNYVKEIFADLPEVA